MLLDCQQVYQEVCNKAIDQDIAMGSGFFPEFCFFNPLPSIIHCSMTTADTVTLCSYLLYILSN